MASIPHALRQIKEDLSHTLSPSRIESACRAVGHRWRARRLGPAQTVYLFALQILHGNIACSALRHISGPNVSASAYCQARARLPLAALKALVKKVISKMVGVFCEEQTWFGHRVIHIDGSSFSMPDEEELQEHFGQPGGQRKGCGFPMAHLCAITHAGTGMIVDLIASPLRTHDMADAAKLHPKMKPGDVLVADRGFCSYVHLALVLLGQMHGVFRMHQRQIVCFGKRRHAKAKKQRQGAPTSTFVRTLGYQDQVVRWAKPKCRPTWMIAEQYASLPDTITVRELRYRISWRGFRTREVTLVTTLLDPDPYSVDALSELYFNRWQIEIGFRHLKQTMGMDVLRCKTVDGVMKELWMFVLIYNLVCGLMVQAARRQGADPNRISFVDALRCLRYRKTRDLSCELVVNPLRELRMEPRACKRRPKTFPLMRMPRDKLRKSLEKKHLAA
jgi:hypothetical protein